MLKDKKGISLIILVVTIIVLIILTATVILNISGGDIIGKAEEAKFKSNLSTFDEELQTTISKQILRGIIEDGTEVGSPDPIKGLEGLQEYIASMNEQYADLLQISEGQLEYIGTDPNESQWARDIGMISDGVKVTTGEATEVIPDGDNYHITKPEDLIWVREQVNTETNLFEGKTVILDNDINLAGLSWTPIGTIDFSSFESSKAFKGTFEGNNKQISNITYDTAQDATQTYIGLFMANLGTIQNLTVNNINFKIPNSVSFGDNTFASGIVGGNLGIVSNCKSIGRFTTTVTNSMIAGICGANINTITNCSNTANVSNQIGRSFTGIALSNEGTISNSYNTGNINAREAASGIVTFINSGTINKCYNTGKIESSSYASGICAMCEIEDNCAISNCYNTGDVKGYNAGGFVGKLERICENECELYTTNSYNVGKIDGTNSESLAASFIGKVIDAINICGFYNCYYLDTSSPYITGNTNYTYGDGNSDGIVSKTSAEMKTSTFATDLNTSQSPAVWEYNASKNNGYPILKY